MVFSSVIFLCLFLPIVLGGYYLLPKREAKNLWLIAASLLFYAFSGLWYVLLLLFSVFCNYLAGLFVSGRKGVLYVAVAVNLGVLGVFKYLTFLVRTVNQLPGVAIAVPSIVLPVGISFFTFQGLSYVIDVYRNERKAPAFGMCCCTLRCFRSWWPGPSFAMRMWRMKLRAAAIRWNNWQMACAGSLLV